MKSNILRKLNGILIFLMGIPLALADEETEDIIGDTLRPNLETGISGLPDNIRTWITWAISVVFVFVIAALIILTLREAILSWWAKKQNRSRERGMHIENVFYGAGILLLMIIAVLLIIFIASNI